MTITDEEINKLYHQAQDNGDYSPMLTFARALLALHTERLAECEMPEAYGYIAHHTHGMTTFSRTSTEVYPDTAISVHAVYTADQLRQAVAQARAKDSVDAERYRFIRGNLNHEIKWRKGRVAFVPTFTNYEYETFKTLDAAIDAAREVK